MEQSQLQIKDSGQTPPDEARKQIESDVQGYQKKQIEAKLYVLKPQQQKMFKGQQISDAAQPQRTSVLHLQQESEMKQQKLLKQNRMAGIVNQQSSGDTDAMNCVGAEDLAFEEGIGSSIESDEWNLMDAGGSKGIFRGLEMQNVINVDFSESQEASENIRHRKVEQIIQNSAFMVQDIGSSIDCTPNNDQNDLKYAQQSENSDSLQLVSGQPQVYIEQSELILVQNNQHKSNVNLNYSPQIEQKFQNKIQQPHASEIMSHAILAPPQQLSQNGQRLHQYSKLIHKTSAIAGTKFVTLNSQLKMNPESISAPATTNFVQGQQQQQSKPHLLTNKKSTGITSSLIAKSSIINTSSTGLRKSHVSPNHSSHIHQLNNKQAKTAIKNFNNDSDFHGFMATPFTYQGSQIQGAQSFHQNTVKSSQLSITPGQVQKQSFLVNSNAKQNSNPSIITGGKLSPRMPQTNSGSYSILARQRSQNKLQSSVSQPQIIVQQPMILQSHQQLAQQQVSSDNSSRSGTQNHHANNLLLIDQEWIEHVQPLLDRWTIPFQVKNAYTKKEVSQLIVSIDREVVQPIRTKHAKEQSQAQQFKAQSQLLETQLQLQLQQQKVIQDSILQVREQFSLHEEILKKMEECRTELKQMMLNSLMCLDFFRDLQGYIGEQRYKKESQDVIHTLNEIEGIMQQHSLQTIEFDNERIQNLAESIQEYVKARQIDKKVININIGDDFDEQKYTSNTSGDNFIFSPTGQYAPSMNLGEDSMHKGSLQVKITRVANHATRIQQAKLINLSQDKELNRSSSSHNRHLNGGCCSSTSKDFTVPLKQTTALDELKVKTAMINRLREQLEHKLKKILVLKEELRVEREETMKTASIKKMQESLIKMEHEYNASVVRNNRLSLDIREIKGQCEEMQREAGRLRNYLRESNKMNQELKTVLEEKTGFKALEKSVAQLSCILVSKRNEVLSPEQREQIRYVFGTSIVIQKLKHKIHQQDDILEKTSTYLVQSLRLNHQYKDLLYFLWPLLKSAYFAQDLDVIKLKLEQIWKTTDSIDAYQYREIDARANFLRELRKNIDKENLVSGQAAAAEHVQTNNFSNEILGLIRGKATVSSSIALDQGDSMIWQGLKNLKKEYSNNIATTTAVKARKVNEDLSKNEFNLSKDTQLLNTQEPGGKKKKRIFRLEENLNQQEDSLLLNDDIDVFNQMMSPFAEEQLHKKFEFGDTSCEHIRTSYLQGVTPIAQVQEQNDQVQKGLAKQDVMPNPEYRAISTPSMTPDIYINQEVGNFTQQTQKEFKQLNSTAEDLKTYSVIQGLGSNEDEMSTYFKQGLKQQQPKTSKKILKEKMKALKQRNTELLSTLRAVQEHVKFLEDKLHARDRSLSSDRLYNDDYNHSRSGEEDPKVFKELGVKKQYSPKNSERIKNIKDDRHTINVSVQYQYEDQQQQHLIVPPIEKPVDKCSSNFEFNKLDFINMISIQAEALENTIFQKK